MAAKTLPDLWSNCYDGDHRKLSPEEFKRDWCGACLNAGCRNSKGSELKWVQRMLTQEDLLLDNPRFADTSDSRFRGIAEQDFPSMVQQALAIEVSSRKGDWSVPTAEEIGAAAAQMVGMAPPTGFQAPEPEPVVEPEPVEEEVEPPPRLVDEVQEYGFKGEPEGPPPVDEHGKFYLSDPGAWKVEVGPDEAVFLSSKDPEPQPEGQWRVRGDTGKLYDVTLKHDGEWECSCPSRENPCKHARDIELKLARAPAAAPAGPPPNPTRPPPGPTFQPRAMNTTLSNAGVMIGGEKPPAPAPAADPWAAPPTKPVERTIPVGGRVTFGSGKKKS